MLLSRCSQSLKHHEGDRFECDPLWVVFFLFFFLPSLLPVSVNYIRTVICHEPIQLGAAAATESVLSCGFPPACCLVIARPWLGPQRPVCSARGINGIVRKRPGLYILT